MAKTSAVRVGLGCPIARIGFAASVFKLILIPASPSTDFEVHRWWAALTYSRPLAEWYTDETSIWTLDYPPLFAYFQFLLAHTAAFMQPGVLEDRLRSEDFAAVLRFMRLSVIATDGFLTYAVYRVIRGVGSLESTILEACGGQADGVKRKEIAMLSSILLLCSPGLHLVDNIHFQFNGLVISFLLLALALFMEERLFTGAFVFTVAVNFKHTLLPAAPPIGIYILSRLYVKAHNCAWSSLFLDAFGILLSIASGLAMTWFPLYRAGGSTALRVCFSRLFPFGRGLLHAYWAPNFWALYAFVDRLSAMLGCTLRQPDASASSGLIGSCKPFVCLPNVTPGICVSLVLASVCPALLYYTRVCTGDRMAKGEELLFARSALLLPRVVSFCLLSAFVFGWHVHEKMVLLAIVPLACVACIPRGYSTGKNSLGYLPLALAGQFALHPLITTTGESMYKVFHFSAYTLLSVLVLGRDYQAESADSRRGVTPSDAHVVHLLVIAFAAMEVYAGVFHVHTIIFGIRTLEFLPLLLISTISAAGILIGYVCLGYVLTNRSITVSV